MHVSERQKWQNIARREACLFAMHYRVLWAEGHFSMMLEIATPVLFLTIEKCIRDCYSGSFLDLHRETSTKCNAVREDYGNKTISLKYTLTVVGIQQ